MPSNYPAENPPHATQTKPPSSRLFLPRWPPPPSTGSSLRLQPPASSSVASSSFASCLKSSIRSAATTPDALASLFLSALPHPAFLGDRPLFSLSVHRLASAGRHDLVTSILSSSLTSASSFLRLPPPASPEATMALLVRARLSSLDEDAAAASSVSSSTSPSCSPSPPLVSPTVRRAAVLGAPRVVAQLSSSTDDEKGEILDGAMDYGEEDEVLEEVSNGFLGVAEASLEEGFASSWSVGGVFDAGARSGLEDDTRGDQDVGAEAVNDVVPEPFIGFAGGIDGGDMRIVDALEGNDGGE